VGRDRPGFRNQKRSLCPQRVAPTSYVGAPTAQEVSGRSYLDVLLRNGRELLPKEMADSPRSATAGLSSSVPSFGQTFYQRV